MAAGYAFENLILEATAMGLGTVWLAATFNWAGFASAMGVPADALFPAISPVGYPAVRRRLTESLMRAAMRSSARKRWRELFYEHDFQTPLAELAAGAYAVPLEVLRLAAPGAQEWQNLREWKLLGVGEEALERPFSTLSRGEQTKALLSALFAREDAYPLIDEPTNHLDAHGRWWRAISGARTAFCWSAMTAPFSTAAWTMCWHSTEATPG